METYKYLINQLSTKSEDDIILRGSMLILTLHVSFLKLESRDHAHL